MLLFGLRMSPGPLEVTVGGKEGSHISPNPLGQAGYARFLPEVGDSTLVIDLCGATGICSVSHAVQNEHEASVGGHLGT